MDYSVLVGIIYNLHIKAEIFHHTVFKFLAESSENRNTVSISLLA